MLCFSFLVSVDVGWFVCLPISFFVLHFSRERMREKNERGNGLDGELKFRKLRDVEGFSGVVSLSVLGSLGEKTCFLPFLCQGTEARLMHQNAFKLFFQTISIFIFEVAGVSQTYVT